MKSSISRSPYFMKPGSRLRAALVFVSRAFVSEKVPRLEDGRVLFLCVSKRGRFWPWESCIYPILSWTNARISSPAGLFTGSWVQRVLGRAYSVRWEKKDKKTALSQYARSNILLETTFQCCQLLMKVMSGRNKTAHRLVFVGSDVDPPLVHEEIPIPELKPGEILGKVLMASICGSDLHTISGRRKEAVPR